MWVPNTRVARRCGAKLLVAARADAIELVAMEQTTCVDVCANPFVPRHTRRKIGLLWLKHGHTVIAWEKGHDEPPLKPKPGDEALENVLAAVG